MAVVERETPWIPEDTFASRLMLVRKQLGLSQDEVAVLCDLKPSTWFTWENGAHPRALVEVVTKIAAATGCDRNWLMWGDFARATHSQEHWPDSHQENLFSSAEAA